MLEMSLKPLSLMIWYFGLEPFSAFQVSAMSCQVIGFPSLQTALGLSLTSTFCGLLLTSLADSTVFLSTSHEPSGLKTTPPRTMGYPIGEVAPQPPTGSEGVTWSQ